jgi:hypothetical protein
MLLKILNFRFSKKPKQSIFFRKKYLSIFVREKKNLNIYTRSPHENKK